MFTYVVSPKYQNLICYNFAKLLVKTKVSIFGAASDCKCCG